MSFNTINELVDFLKSNFGRYDQYNAGNYQFKCVNKQCSSLLKKGKKKLGVNVHKQIFNCWVCGYKGRLYKLVKENCSRETLIEYVKNFADENLVLKEEENQIEKANLPEDFSFLALNQNNEKHIKYLKSRNIDLDDFWYFKLGMSEITPFGGRVIMPSFDRSGNLNFYSARLIYKSDKRITYILPKFPKNEIIFNEINIDWSKELTITEGPFDLVKCNQNATILSGSAFSDESLLFIKILQNSTPILLALDKDVEYTKTLEHCEMLMSYNIPVRILDLGDYKDVGSMTKEEFEERRLKSKHYTKESLLKRKIYSIGSERLLLL